MQKERKKHSFRAKVEELFIKKRQWNLVVFGAMIRWSLLCSAGAGGFLGENVLITAVLNTTQTSFPFTPVGNVLLPIQARCTTQLVSIMVCWTSQSKGLWDNISCMSLVSLSPVLPHTPITTSVQIFKKTERKF